MNSNIKKVLIIIIIIALIVMFVNSLTGKNGFLQKGRKKNFLAEISQTMTDMEKNIANIKAQNSGNVLSSAEMLKSLESKGLISLSRKGIMQGNITSSNIENLVIGYNGDVYLNNYKEEVFL